MKYTREEILETILARAIREEINKTIIKAIKDPTFEHGMSPMIFEDEETKKSFKENFERVVNRDIEGWEDNDNSD